MNKKILLITFVSFFTIFVFTNIVFGENITVNCTDSDGGNNFTLKGITIGFPNEYMSKIPSNLQTVQDFCINDQWVQEYFCMSTDSNSQFYGVYSATSNECSSCKDGACVSTKEIISCEGSTDSMVEAYSYGSQIKVNYSDGTQKIFTDGCGISSGSGEVGIQHYFCGVTSDNKPHFWSVLKSCYNGCVDGFCVLPTNTTCTDSDSYKNYYVKGCLNNGVCDQCGLRETNGTLANKDYCKDESNCVLFEAYCTPSAQYGSYYSEDYKCPNGCKDGACIKLNNTCTDSDGGKNYYVVGSVTYSNNPGQPNDVSSINTDYCLDKTNLVEQYCENNNYKSMNYQCPNGCSGGACIKGKEPYCDAINSKSEGWYQYGNLIDYEFCNGCHAVCKNIGTKTEGWYSSCTDQAIKYEICGSSQNICTTHADCSQACDNLGINFHWTGTGNNYKSWTGSCLKNAYGCMTGKCCIGQCKQPGYLKEGTCYCQQTNLVDIYGSICPTGETCGSDCYCHPVESKKAYLGQASDLNKKESVEIVDYKNMIVTLDELETLPSICKINTKPTVVAEVGEMPGSTSGGAGCSYGGWMATVSMKMPVELTSLSIKINAGETKEIFPGITLNFVSVTGSTARFIISQKSNGINFNVKTDKYSYAPGEGVRIIAVLSGESSFDFKDTNIVTNVIDPNGKYSEVKMETIGVSAPTCAESASTGTYTCTKINEYNFIGTFNIPSDGVHGIYKVTSVAIFEKDRKVAETNFEVGSMSTSFVDVSIDPKEQYTMIGKEVSYKVTVSDKHPSPVCIAETIKTEETKTTIVPTPCRLPIYNYLISVDGLPYHTVFPNVVSVQAGGSKTFELKVFPSPEKTAEGITTAVQTTSTQTATTTTERTVGITGKAIATQTETKPLQEVKEASFKFTVKASLREDSTVSDSAMGILYVKFVEIPEPPPFPDVEKINIELRKGWNFVSAPGKGVGFTQGTCSVDKKPVAFVYLQEQEKYVGLEDALNIMGKDKLLEYLSTHSFWIYSYEECNIGFKFKSYSTYSGLSIVQGWNLLGITKDMTGGTLGNIKGTCTFDKIYTWDSESQKWIEKSENDLIEKMGYGILVRAIAPCNLKENIIQPPSFPGE